MRLTVAVPTYDRPAEIRRAVERVLPQLAPGDEVLVLDNASPHPVADALADIVRPPGVAVRVERHRVNVGGAANILRCFELCATEWMWLLGDDDTIAESAVRHIREAIARHPHACHLNFRSETHVRARTVVTRGLDGFVRGMDSWSNQLFMSTGVYRADRVAPHVRMGYHYSYALAPHVAALMAALGGDGEVVFSDQQIIAYHAAAQWSPFNAYLGFATLLDFPMPDATRRVLAERLSAAVRVPRVAAYLVRAFEEGLDPAEGRFFVGQLRARLFAFERRPHVRAQLGLLGTIARWPTLALRTVRAAERVLRAAGRGGHSLDSVAVYDRFAR